MAHRRSCQFSQRGGAPGERRRWRERLGSAVGEPQRGLRLPIPGSEPKDYWGWPIIRSISFCLSDRSASAPGRRRRRGRSRSRSPAGCVRLVLCGPGSDRARAPSAGSGCGLAWGPGAPAHLAGKAGRDSNPPSPPGYPLEPARSTLFSMRLASSSLSAGSGGTLTISNENCLVYGRRTHRIRGEKERGDCGTVEGAGSAVAHGRGHAPGCKRGSTGLLEALQGGAEPDHCRGVDLRDTRLDDAKG